MQDDLQRSYQRAQQLQERVDALEAKLGDVCGGYVDVTSELAPFLTRYRAEVLRYHRALVQAQREIADVRAYLGDKTARRGGEAQSPLDDYLRRDEAPVQGLYEQRRSAQQERPRVGGPETRPVQPQVRTLYTAAVAMLHPDLALTASERRSRIGLFNQVNIAYLKRDEHALQVVVDMVTPHSNLPAVADNRALDRLLDRIYALEELIARVEGHIYDFRYGDVARLHEDALRAEAQGHDLIAELSRRVQAALRDAVEELRRLKENLEQLEE